MSGSLPLASSLISNVLSIIGLWFTALNYKIKTSVLGCSILVLRKVNGCDTDEDTMLMGQW